MIIKSLQIIFEYIKKINKIYKNIVDQQVIDDHRERIEDLNELNEEINQKIENINVNRIHSIINNFHVIRSICMDYEVLFYDLLQSTQLLYFEVTNKQFDLQKITCTKTLDKKASMNDLNIILLKKIILFLYKIAKQYTILFIDKKLVDQQIKSLDMILLYLEDIENVICNVDVSNTESISKSLFVVFENLSCCYLIFKNYTRLLLDFALQLDCNECE